MPHFINANYGVPTGGVPKVNVDNYDRKIAGDLEVMAADKVTDTKNHNHYFKDVSHLKTIDVYRVLDLFSVTDPSIAHATKKLLVAGGRGAGKDIHKDIQEAIDSLVRWQEMQRENNNV